MCEANGPVRGLTATVHAAWRGEEASTQRVRLSSTPPTGWRKRLGSGRRRTCRTREGSTAGLLARSSTHNGPTLRVGWLAGWPADANSQGRSGGRRIARAAAPARANGVQIASDLHPSEVFHALMRVER